MAEKSEKNPKGAGRPPGSSGTSKKAFVDDCNKLAMFFAIAPEAADKAAKELDIIVTKNEFGNVYTREGDAEIDGENLVKKTMTRSLIAPMESKVVENVIKVSLVECWKLAK